MRLAPLRGTRKPEVQMSPLIDVIFLLLIFYAVTTQFVSDERLKLKLPEAETAESVGVRQEEKPPEVKVAADGTIWIDDQIVPEMELESRIRQLVERAPVDDLFDRPLHPYTEALLRCIPRLSDERPRLQVIPGSVPDPRALPPGCRFHPRCSSCVDRCRDAGVGPPPLCELGHRHWVACHEAQT